MGRHRRNQLCNHCGQTEGELVPGTNEHVTLIVDLEEYEDSERVFQAPRSPDNPLPQFLVWCFRCAREIARAGDHIDNFREVGFSANCPDGPYASWLAKNRTGFNWARMRGTEP